jgi:hypothetical protein
MPADKYRDPALQPIDHITLEGKTDLFVPGREYAVEILLMRKERG